MKAGNNRPCSSLSFVVAVVLVADVVVEKCVILLTNQKILVHTKKI